MPLREQLEHHGNWLFRRRSYLPVLLFALMLPAVWRIEYPGGGRHDLDLAWEMLCLAVCLIGLAIRIKTVGHSPRGTSGRNTRSQLADVLNTTGMYSIVRHPLYLGNALMWLGVAMFPRSAWLVLGVGLSFWLYYERIMLAEEEFLRRRFGEDYMRWATATPAFLPNFRLWTPPYLAFSLRTVFRREYSGFLGVVASLVFLEWIGDISAGEGFRLDPVWAVLLGATLLLYLVLRTLKKRTRYLDVPGR